jgi:hypothetical protein
VGDQYRTRTPYRSLDVEEASHRVIERQRRLVRETGTSCEEMGSRAG